MCLKKILFASLIFIGLILLSIWYIEKNNILKVEHNGFRTWGVIIKKSFKSNAEYDWLEYELNYRDSSQSPHQITYVSSVADSGYKIGEVLPIIYDSRNPNNSIVNIIDTQSRNSLLLYIGLIMLLAGTAGLLLTAPAFSRIKQCS